MILSLVYWRGVLLPPFLSPKIVFLQFFCIIFARALFTRDNLNAWLNSLLTLRLPRRVLPRFLSFFRYPPYFLFLPIKCALHNALFITHFCLFKSSSTVIATSAARAELAFFARGLCPEGDSPAGYVCPTRVCMPNKGMNGPKGITPN